MTENNFHKKIEESSIIYNLFKEADSSWKDHLKASSFLMEMDTDLPGRKEFYDELVELVKKKYRRIAFRAHLIAFGGMIDIKKCDRDYDRTYDYLKNDMHLVGNVMKEAACHILHVFLDEDIKEMLLTIDECVQPNNRLELYYWFKRARERHGDKS